MTCTVTFVFHLSAKNVGHGRVRAKKSVTLQLRKRDEKVTIIIIMLLRKDILLSNTREKQLKSRIDSLNK